MRLLKPVPCTPMGIDPIRDCVCQLSPNRNSDDGYVSDAQIHGVAANGGYLPAADINEGPNCSQPSTERSLRTSPRSRRKADWNDLFSQPCHPSLTSNHRAAIRMNPRVVLRRHPQENRETVEKSEISELKNETFWGKLTLGILKSNARNGAITGLQPNRKRGQRKSVPFVNGGAGGI